MVVHIINIKYMEMDIWQIWIYVSKNYVFDLIGLVNYIVTSRKKKKIEFI